MWPRNVCRPNLTSSRMDAPPLVMWKRHTNTNTKILLNVTIVSHGLKLHGVCTCDAVVMGKKLQAPKGGEMMGRHGPPRGFIHIFVMGGNENPNHNFPLWILRGVFEPLDLTIFF